MSLLTPVKTDRGWIIEVDSEMGQVMGIAEGSLVLMYGKEGIIETEILPPPSPQLKKNVQRLQEKYKDVFAELKRLGD